MIQSMTGYGKAEKTLHNKTIIVEIRSLNSKNLDVKTRIPSEYREKELEIRKMLAKDLKRGKVDFNLSIENIEEEPKNKINEKVLMAYMEQLQNLQPDADTTALMVAALRLPDVLKTEKKEIDEEEWQTVLETMQEAINKLVAYRKHEGQSLEADLQQRIENIRNNLSEITKLDANRIERIKIRLTDALDKLKIEVDTNRFEQELTYYLEKFDINEEKVRLTNHLDYFVMELQNANEMKGKKLGFISQEMGREINTTGSKANDSSIQQYVVQMKDELEKVKEQVLNAL